MHGAGLYNDRYGTFRLAEQRFSPSERAVVDEFLAQQALFQQSLAARVLGRQRHTHVTTDSQVWYNYLLLQVWDRLSLQYAFRLAADGEIPRCPIRTARRRCSAAGTRATCRSAWTRIPSTSRRARFPWRPGCSPTVPTRLQRRFSRP
jgi:hypothetical protein